jgi:hypothetical protein
LGPWAFRLAGDSRWHRNAASRSARCDRGHGRAGGRLHRVRAAGDRPIALGDAGLASHRGSDIVLQRTDRRCAGTGVASGRRSVDRPGYLLPCSVVGLGHLHHFLRRDAVSDAADSAPRRDSSPAVELCGCAGGGRRRRRTADFGQRHLQLLRRCAVAHRRFSGVLDRHQRGGTAGPRRVAARCGRHVHRLACGVFALSSDGVRRGGQCRGWMADLQRTQCPCFRAGAMAGCRTDHCARPCRAGPADRLRDAVLGGAASAREPSALPVFLSFEGPLRFIV